MISHTYTKLHTQPYILVGWSDTPGDQNCPHMLSLIQLDGQHNFIRCSKGTLMHLKCGTDTDTVHTYLPRYLKQLFHLYHDMFWNLVLLVPVKFYKALHPIRYYRKKVNAINGIQSCRVLWFTELNFSVLPSLGSGQWTRHDGLCEINAKTQNKLNNS